MVPSGTIAGVVHDGQGQALAGVAVRLQTQDGKIVAQTMTAAGGSYDFTGIAPGVYTLVANGTGRAAVTLAAAAGATADMTVAPDASPSLEEITIIAKKLTEARSSIQPRIGATTYTLSDRAIQNQPGGDDIPLNQTLLQTPGVSQDSYGQIHLRNDHANIQYRIDGVILPEGISFFGQSLTSRFASSIDLITGSLPAQYGLVTTGIIDIQTKSGSFEPGGSAGIYGGSHGWVEPSAEYAGSAGTFNYYVAGDYLENDLGVENPTSSHDPIHDATQQGHAFAYLEDILDDTSKVSVILGAYQSSFQIPDNPGQVPAFQLGSQTSFNSAQLNENQEEANDYGAISYLKATEDYDFQVSAFLRYSNLDYTPDRIGDLMFYGLAQNASRTDVAEGLQADGTYRLGGGHTLRFGGLITAETATSSTDSLVFPCFDPACTNVGTSPVAVNESNDKTGWTYSIYVQDQWDLTPTVTLNYGGRFDILNGYTNANQISPRINAVWKPDTDTSFHAGYSRYFTPPALELIAGGSIAKFAGTTGFPGGYTPANPPQDGPILPERSDYFDVGADRVVLPGLKLGVDAYYKLATDLIDEGQFGAPIILSVFNYAHANVYGLEFSGSYDLGNWSAYGNVSIGRERAKKVASQQFNFAPDDLAYIASNYIYTDHNQWITASGGISYNWSGTRLSVDGIHGSGLRQDSGIVPNGGTVPPYTQVNFGVSHRFDDTPAGPLELSLNLINAFDESYQIRSGSGVGVFAPQYGPRRSIYAGARVFF